MLVSKRKRYLSGPDWVIATFDHLMKNTTGSGNMSQIVLVLDLPINASELRRHLDHFVQRLPVLWGKIRRDFKLAPYWEIPQQARSGTLFSVSYVASANTLTDFLPSLVTTANVRFNSEREHLIFHLFVGTHQACLAMSFDHRLFDARGAESFLSFVQQHISNGAHCAALSDITFTSSAELTQWKKKLLAGRNVNRRIIALSKSTPAALPLPHGTDRGYKYRLLSFNEKETSVIYDRAYSEAGYLMESPYFLAVIIQSIHKMFLGNHLSSSSYLIPVTMDLRPGLDPVTEIFFNHVSYLFYQIHFDAVTNLKMLIQIIKQQMYDQVKSGFPKDIAEASLLTRIVPLPVLGKILHLPLKGKIATFVFSHLGKSTYQFPCIMNNNISNIFHMPRVPVPPGLGFFSNYYKEKFNMVISYLEGMLSDADLDTLEYSIRSKFGLR